MKGFRLRHIAGASTMLVQLAMYVDDWQNLYAYGGQRGRVGFRSQQIVKEFKDV